MGCLILTPSSIPGKSHMNLVFLFFILCLPAIGALGFDVWLAYGETMDFSKSLELSSVGWLWVNYAEDNYNLMKESIDAATWTSVVKPLLSQKLVTVALLPVYIAVPTLLIMKIFGWGRYQGAGLMPSFGKKKFGKGKGYAHSEDVGGKQRKKMNYKRN